MSKPLTIIVLLLATGTLHANELLRNGDFTRGTVSWKGDRKVVDEDENKYAVIDLDQKKAKALIQEKLNTKNVRDITLSFRYRTSENYDGGGITLRYVREKGGSTFRTIRLQPTKEWKTYQWDFNNSKQSDELTLRIEVLRGTGSIQFDDFSAIAK